MDFVTSLIFSLTFSGMAFWVRSLYSDLERTRTRSRVLQEANRRMHKRLDEAESKLKSYELF